MAGARLVMGCRCASICSVGKAARHEATVDPAAGWRSTDPISPGSMSWWDPHSFKAMVATHR